MIRPRSAISFTWRISDVNPGLVALYRQLDAAGRARLPAAQRRIVGVADGGAVKIATARHRPLPRPAHLQGLVERLPGSMHRPVAPPAQVILATRPAHTINNGALGRINKSPVDN